MCGRYSLTDFETLKDYFVAFDSPEELQPRYNIAPSQEVLAVRNTPEQVVKYLRWGLIPFWAKDEKIGNRMINARSKTLAEKKTFKGPYRSQRYLILTTGIYEWHQDRDGNKTPIYFRLRSKDLFRSAGLWESWTPEDGDGSPILSRTIITTSANELVGQYHHRMPVILPESAYMDWLDPEEAEPDMLDPRLAPYPAEELEAYPISTRVNNPSNDSPDLTRPAV